MTTNPFFNGLLSNAATIKMLLAKHDVKISKTLGQNFMCDDAVVAALVDAAAPTRDDCVLEIGPGLGVLTRALSERAGSVVAVEIARHLAPLLKETLSDLSNVRLIIADFLHIAADELGAGKGPFAVAANLPYAITTPALFRFLDGEIGWSRMAVTVQAEVAERMVASPSTREYGALSVAAQSAARIEIVRRIPSSCFWPKPKVESAIVKLSPFAPHELSRPKNLRLVLRTAFSARRKIMKNSVASLPGGVDALERCGIDPSSRPETVSVPQWIAFARSLDKLGMSGNPHA